MPPFGRSKKQKEFDEIRARMFCGQDDPGDDIDSVFHPDFEPDWESAFPEDLGLNGAGRPTRVPSITLGLGDIKSQAIGGGSLLQELEDSNQIVKCRWKLPEIKEVAIETALGGVGALIETGIRSAMGEGERIKQLVPMSSERWARWVMSVSVSNHGGAVPVIGHFVTAFSGTMQSYSEGKGWRDISKDQGAAQVGGLIGDALGIGSLGGYTVYLEVAAPLKTAFTLYEQASGYVETWDQTKIQIEQIISRLDVAFRANRNFADMPTVGKFLNRRGYLEDQLTKGNNRIDKMTKTRDKCKIELLKVSVEFNRRKGEFKAILDRTSKRKGYQNL
jgi:hypothetical protein